MAQITKCEICKNPANKKCAKCWNVVYCSKEHQQVAWKDHQKICRPFQVSSSLRLGRHIVATKPIPEGDVVLQELPLATGFGEHVFICAGCLKSLDTNYQECKKCGWLVCNEECQNNPNHKPECYYFSKSGIKVNAVERMRYGPISLILRCLYQKQFNTEIWGKLKQLESHMYDYGMSDRATLNEAIAETLSSRLNLNKCFTEEDIQRVCGVAETNSFTTDMDHVALYDVASLFEHSCSANCRKVFNSQNMIRIIAARTIKEGEHLSVSYTSGLRPTFKRRSRLEKTKFFKCLCERCTDVTEFGTNFSALNCPNRNCDGNVLPLSFVMTNPKWLCNKCSYEMSVEEVKNIHQSADIALAAAKLSNNCNMFMEMFKKALPENHSYMIEAKLDYVFTTGDIFGFENVSYNEIKTKISLCRELIKFLQVIVPAEKGLRGHLLNELQRLLGETYRRKNENRGRFERADRLRILEERKSFLTEIVEITKFKYDEDQPNQKAKAELEEVENLMQKLK